MLGATHTMVLNEILKLAGCGFESLKTPGGSAMTFGNLLPDSMALVGVLPEVSHDIKRATRLAGILPALGTGVMVHIFTDNLTHCNNVLDDGNYGASTALRLGLALMEKTGNKYSELLKNFSARSMAYTLHTVIELAADVLVGEDDFIVAAIEKAWGDAVKHRQSFVNILKEIYGMDMENLNEESSKFLSMKRPSREEIYSRKARAEMFLRKFAPKEYSDEQRVSDRAAIMEMIEAGEDMMRGMLSPLVHDFACRILDFDPALKDRVVSIIQSERFPAPEMEKDEQL